MLFRILMKLWVLRHLNHELNYIDTTRPLDEANDPRIFERTKNLKFALYASRRNPANSAKVIVLWSSSILERQCRYVCMTQFDYEMKLFEEIKNKYRPIKGYHLVLDLDAYKKGEEIIQKFKFDSEEYFNLVNIERNKKNKEIVLITSNIENTIHYVSKAMRARFDYDKNLLLEFEDYAPNPYKLNRSLRHQMELLIYDLTHPKPEKPIC